MGLRIVPSLRPDRPQRRVHCKALRHPNQEVRDSECRRQACLHQWGAARLRLLELLLSYIRR